MHCRIEQRPLRFRAPIATAKGPILERQSWIIAISDDDGRIGLGEASPLPAFGGEDAETCAAALLKATARLDGRFISDWLKAENAATALGDLEAMLSAAPCARFAFEGALIDLLAQRLGRSVADVLASGKATRSVAVNALLTGGDPAALEREVQDLRRKGFSTFKLKVGLANDLARIAAVRSAAGASAHIRVDANGAWNLDQAKAFAQQARSFDLEYYEQPLPTAQMDQHAALRGIMKVALDESVRSPGDVAEIARAKAADVVVLKPMLLGGWQPTARAAAEARVANMAVVITSSLDGSIGRAYATHITAALGLDQHAHGLATGHLLRDEFTSAPLQPDDGKICLSAQRGLGIGALKPWPFQLPGVSGAARWLLDGGCKSGSRIALIGEQSPGFAAILQAAPLIGVTVVLINHRLNDNERAQQIARSAARLLADPPDSFPEVADPPWSPLADEDPCCVLFTSGTSGEAKAARLSWRAIRSACDHAIAHLSLSTKDRWIACLPFDHIGGASLVYRAGRCGYDLVTMPFAPESINARIDIGDITGISLVPTMLHRLLSARGDRRWPTALRHILLGGGPCDAALANRSAALGLYPSLTYGLTETASQLCTLLPSQSQRHATTVGRALPEMELRIRDGEIQVRGNQLFSGYEKNGVLVAPQDADEWFATGDLGALDADGYLTVHCRREDLIVSGGENVYPAEVEAALCAHPAIKEAAVCGLADPEWGQVVAAVLVAHGQPCSDAEVRAWCDARLSRFKQPKRWLWRGELERGSRGKIKREALTAWFRS